jgi:hypothetical protein
MQYRAITPGAIFSSGASLALAPDEKLAPGNLHVLATYTYEKVETNIFGRFDRRIDVDVKIGKNSGMIRIIDDFAVVIDFVHHDLQERNEIPAFLSRAHPALVHIDVIPRRRVQHVIDAFAVGEKNSHM